MLAFVVFSEQRIEHRSLYEHGRFILEEKRRHLSEIATTHALREPSDRTRETDLQRSELEPGRVHSGNPRALWAISHQFANRINQAGVAGGLCIIHEIERESNGYAGIYY